MTVLNWLFLTGVIQARNAPNEAVIIFKKLVEHKRRHSEQEEAVFYNIESG